MFAVIFELQPKQEKFDEYLKLAKYLKPKLEAVDGFIDIDRFASKRTKGRLLSFSTWRDEKAVVRWRTQAEHHAVQKRAASTCSRTITCALARSRWIQRSPRVSPSKSNASTRPTPVRRRLSPLAK